MRVNWPLLYCMNKFDLSSGCIKIITFCIYKSARFTKINRDDIFMEERITYEAKDG